MVNWQPNLTHEPFQARVLVENDFENLYKVASDPLVWEQHPRKERYKKEIFERFFQKIITFPGALVVVDNTTQEIIGSSSYCSYDAPRSTVEIGCTFFARKCWNKGYNRALKILMLKHAFQFVDRAIFIVDENNFRSQTAMEKLGAKNVAIKEETDPDGTVFRSIVYEIERASFFKP